MRKRSEAGKAKQVTPEVADLSRQINEAINPPPLFASANQGEQYQLPVGYQRIVESIHVPDPEAEYARLERALTVGEQRTDYGSLNAALDRAEDNARAAHRLYLAAKLQRERYELEAEPVIGAMRDQATAKLEQEKVAGTRKKQITDADVRAYAATMFPDEWTAQQMALSQVQAMEKMLERLADLWLRRCSSLATMLSSLRK